MDELTNRLLASAPSGKKGLVPFSHEVLDVIQEAHQGEHITNIHLGINRTYEQLLMNGYYWHNCREDIKRFILNCRPCNELVPNFLKKPSGQIISNFPRERYQCDLCEVNEDIKLASGNSVSYIFTIKDHFSKYIWSSLIGNKQAITVLVEIRKCFKEIGHPLIFQSDNGGEFVNNSLETYFNELKDPKTVHQRGFPKMPKQQGAVERSHRTLHHNLIRIVKAFTESGEKFTVHDEYFKLVQSYNERKHTTTKFPPNYVFTLDKNIDKTVIGTVKNNISKTRIKKKGKFILKKGDYILIKGKVKPSKDGRTLVKTGGKKTVGSNTYTIPGIVNDVFDTSVLATIYKNFEEKNIYAGAIFIISYNIIKLVEQIVWENIVFS